MTTGQEMNLKASRLIVLRASVWINLIFGSPKRQFAPLSENWNKSSKIDVTVKSANRRVTPV